MKGIQIQKEEIQLSVCRWLDYLCRKSQSITQESLMELINNYSKVAENRINIQKSLAFLYISSEQL